VTLVFTSSVSFGFMRQTSALCTDTYKLPGVHFYHNTLAGSLKFLKNDV